MTMRSMIESNYFSSFIVVIIVFNAAVLGAQTALRAVADNIDLAHLGRSCMHGHFCHRAALETGDLSHPIF